MLALASLPEFPLPQRLTPIARRQAFWYDCGLVPALIFQSVPTYGALAWGLTLFLVEAVEPDRSQVSASPTFFYG